MRPRIHYTIGWICAISTEYVAAQAFLDEERDGPEYVSPNDNNNYTLGKVRRHNVVIAVLPDGEYGTASTAIVARDMCHSFPNIRINLMVGIGGGAPSPKHDIRLGDIVVSAPRDGKGGVFQYDFGKTIQGQSFMTIGFLNQPPTSLRAAMNGLKAQYESEGHQLEAAINSVLEKNVRLQRKYKRPGPSNDRLYQSEITHPPNHEISCAIACGDDPSKLILRPERSKDEDNPVIHYGLVASANQLMKDALVRDRLAAENDVLCFETEAAGLMNHFPCLVIRGICDYSDSHKNEEWQGYAAIAAAAYAKDLLGRIPPSRVEAEKKVGEHFSGILDTISKLAGIDYGPQQANYIKRRQAGTGQWFLDSAEYHTWLNTDKQTLFCPGIPGAGKTILTSIAIDDLTTKHQHDPSTGIAYIYCNFRRWDKQKAINLYTSILKQLSQGRSSLPEYVKDLYDRHKDKRTRPSFEEISRTLQSVADMYSRVFIIIDALDECQASDSSRARFLAEIFNLQARSGVNLFATSRFIPDIVERFKEEESLLLEIRASDEDVLKSWKTTITQAVDGMFVLAHIHLDFLLNTTSPKAFQTALAKIPIGSEAYDYVYEGEMKRIKAQRADEQQLAKQVLSWITHAKRPLTTLELQHALAVEVGELKLDEENLPQIEDIISVCIGLVTVDEESSIIRFTHYTMQEYFERTRGYWFPNAEIDITTICVTYLSFNVFESGVCETDDEFEERLRSNPFFKYAAQNWGHHARNASILSQELSQAILNFLESEAKVAASSQGLLVVKASYINYSQDFPRDMSGLHLIAYFGVEAVAKLLLDTGKIDVDSKDSCGQTPLRWAAYGGHEAVVKLLLETGKLTLIY
ncbi:purine and uridine phosphorylase [Acephala macrosclerotiorum]|nr:purine and uridine phosphorylase [Acephala macrosclerotiorum]